MSLRYLTVAGITVRVADDQATPPPTPAQQTTTLFDEGRGSRTRVRRTCPALFGAAPCGEPAEPGEGNPEGYCTRHLDLMAGDQEDWETDAEYARRRRQLCPHQTGSGMPWIGWCPEPSDPESESGYCLIHEPTYNPEAPEYDAEAAHRLLDESVPCLQCRGVPGCDMCAGTGRITLRRANWHRGDDALPPPDDPDPTQGASVTTDQPHVVEGLVIGHARCSYKEGCTEPPERVVDVTPRADAHDLSSANDRGPMTTHPTDATKPDPTSHAQALRERGLTLEPCSGCGVEPGQEHQDGCDHACCPDCGEQLIFHDCDAWDPDADGPDRAALWHGIDPRKEVAQTLNWWTTHARIDHLVEDYTRVLFADALHQIAWDPHGQKYLVGQIDNAALDRAIARSR